MCIFLSKFFVQLADGSDVMGEDGKALIHTDGTGYISEDLARGFPWNDFYKLNDHSFEVSDQLLSGTSCAFSFLSFTVRLGHGSNFFQNCKVRFGFITYLRWDPFPVPCFMRTLCVSSYLFFNISPTHQS